MTQITQEKLFTPAEIAEKLGMTRENVYRMIKAGELHAIKLSPRRVRIPERSLEELLMERYSKEA